jgi:hypothetical protein
LDPPEHLSGLGHDIAPDFVRVIGRACDQCDHGRVGQKPLDERAVGREEQIVGERATVGVA